MAPFAYFCQCAFVLLAGLAAAAPPGAPPSGPPPGDDPRSTIAEIGSRIADIVASSSRKISVPGPAPDNNQPDDNKPASTDDAGGPGGKKGFTLQQISTGIPVSAGSKLIATAQRWNPESVPALLANAKLAATPQDNGHNSVSVTPSTGDKLYLTPITVGGQSIQVMIDTGSSDFWLTTPQANTDGLPANQLYDPSKSSTASPVDARFDEVYVDNTYATGNVYKDDVVIGNLSLSSQFVEALDEGNASNAMTPGMLGLAAENMASMRPRQNPVIADNIFSALDNPVLGIDLKHNAPGSFDFGWIDSSKYTGPLTQVPYVAVVSATQGGAWWGTSLNGYQVGERAAVTVSTDTIIDTGTSSLAVPKPVSDAYHRGIQGAQYHDSGFYTVPCNTTLPDLHLTLGTYVSTIPGEGLFFQNQDGDPSMCWTGLFVTASNGPSWILGDIWLKHNFVVLTGGANKAIHIAAKSA